MIDVGRVTGLVLAGGRGTRMGSIDKAWAPFRGRPMIAHVLARFAPQVGSLLINANRDPARHTALGYRVIADAIGDHDGPLAGFHAGLLACETDCLMVVPCDAPFLPLDLVARLAAPVLDGTVDVAIATTTVRSHPVFCALRTDVVDSIERRLGKGQRSIGAWAADERSMEILFDDEDAFRNLNTPEELRDAENDPRA